ncbi:hypothetical protein Trydic_g20180 [Trypoxylus dichotomus]
MIKLAKESNQNLTFLHKARQLKIIPKGLMNTLPVSSKRAKGIAKGASEALVRKRITCRRLAEIRVTQESEKIRHGLSSILSDSNLYLAIDTGISTDQGITEGFLSIGDGFGEHDVSS